MNLNFNFIFTFFYHLVKILLLSGEVSEWFKVQTWNVCVGATPPGVRIPPSPFLDFCPMFYLVFALIMNIKGDFLCFTMY